MTEIISLLPFLKDTSSVTFWVGVVLIVVAIWMKFRKISLDEFSTKGTRLDAEFQRLTEALDIMSKRLHEANEEADKLRKQVAEMHNQILKLSTELSYLRSIHKLDQIDAATDQPV